MTLRITLGRLTCALLTVAALHAVARDANADTPAPEPNPEAPSESKERGDDAEIRALLAAADAAFRAERFAEAETHYEEAYAKKPTFDVAANLADCERKLGKNAEAAGHYAYALRTFPASFDPVAKASIGDALAEVERKVARVQLVVSARGAHIEVNGHAAGESPLADPVFLDPGTHKLRASLGDQNAERTLTVSAGSRHDLHLDLESNVEKPDGSAFSPVVAGIGFGIGGAGLVAAIALTVVANDKASEADELSNAIVASGTRCEPGSAVAACTDLRDADDARATFSNAALGAWLGSGALLVATGLYTAITMGTAGEETNLSIVALPLAGGAFLSLEMPLY
jgi:tetratricopeptide (TPR) repeat protein